jgi:hypothetical protein
VAVQTPQLAQPECYLTTKIRLPYPRRLLPIKLVPRFTHGTLNDFNYASAGFSDVSGFYGPGSWAAWFLAMVSSLYALHRCPDIVTTLTIISPILYTN